MKIGFIGFGNMAQALAHGLVRGKAVEAGNIGACARDRAKLQRNTEPHGFRAFDDAASVAEFADIVVVAVKPYQVEAVVTPVRELLAEKIVVSVAAGVTFDDYERMLLPGTAHLSTVPNTPVSVCEGIVVCERRHSLSDAQWTSVEKLFSTLGSVIPMDTALLGISSTVCGCGPAFVAMFMEALADGAVKHGVPRGAHAQGRGAEPWPRLARPRQLSDDGSAARGQDSMSESVQPLYVAVQKEHTAVCSALEQLEK